MKVLSKSLVKLNLKKIHDYVDEIKGSNPETTCFVNSKETSDGQLMFTTFYVCFK